MVISGERVVKRDQKRKVQACSIYSMFFMHFSWVLLYLHSGVECSSLDVTFFTIFAFHKVPGRISEAPSSPAQSNKRPRKLKASDG